MKLFIAIAEVGLLISLAVSSAAYAASSTMTVTEDHPVMVAVAQLEKIYMIPISYEDTRYDASELTTNEKGQQIFRTWPVSFTYELPATDATLADRKDLAAKAISTLLQSYNTIRNTEMFTVIPTDAGFRVAAVQFISSSGQPQQMKPLLDTKISIAPRERTAVDAINEIGIALSVPPAPTIHPAPGVWRNTPDHKTNLTASNEPAWSVMNRLLQEIPVGYQLMGHVVSGGSMSWSVRCVPLDLSPPSECTIQTHAVVPERTPTINLEEQPADSILTPDTH